jgi:glycosyltransferase involved in cell wall biosynthesis
MILFLEEPCDYRKCSGRELISIFDLFQKTPVTHYDNGVGNLPEVSVCAQTYNHKKNIHACHRGLINQKVPFEYEILLGWDESTDGTRKICIEYAHRYPSLIKLFLHSRSNDFEVNGTLTGHFNFIITHLQAVGKYLTYCDGDDEWIDHLKLQKQMDFIEAHSEVIILNSVEV